MSTPVLMPQMGESIAEGTIVRWIKKVGDAVDRDEPLFEISTDKVDAEIPSPAAGVLTDIRVKEGETVPVNSVVAVIAAAGGEPHHVTSMTWYFTDKAEYLANLRPIGAVYREVMGNHYPAMAAVQVVALIEDRAKVEIQATAVVPD